MVNTKEILAKQSEILSHQKNFNFILAVATTFLVLTYSLQGASYFSRYSGVILDIIVVVAFLMIALLIYLARKEFPKLLRIVGIIKRS